jgi:magnesium-transporting ATPase (P-type)
MITGDNPLTAKAIAAEAGVDDFLAEATPEEKLALIRREQHGGHMVAMTGDGTNDAPALAQADVGLAMNTGTQAAKEAGNMVDLDSNPTKLIEVVEVAKQLLITRGSLTTFSIANDVAKYFAIIPAMFVVVYPRLRVLNIMHLDSPHTSPWSTCSSSTSPWTVGHDHFRMGAAGVRGCGHRGRRAAARTVPGRYLPRPSSERAIVIVGGLIYFPMLILGPIGERIAG